MRRHPLGGVRPGVGPALAAGVLLAGCGVAPGSSPTLPPPVSITISTAPGETLAYVPSEARVAASGAVLVTFRNDSSLAHNLVFGEPLVAATRTIVEPGETDQLLLDPITPGSHPFICTIHAGMSGVLLVEPGSP